MRTRESSASTVTLVGHYCPSCLRRVPTGATRRRPYLGPGVRRGAAVTLLHCPVCGLVLAAEVAASGIAAPGIAAAA
jgi:hypothetical protein